MLPYVHDFLSLALAQIPMKNNSWKHKLLAIRRVTGSQCARSTQEGMSLSHKAISLFSFIRSEARMESGWE
jgi:hypothetical protein